MDTVKQFLLLSEKLYAYLGQEPEDKEDARDAHIAFVHKLLDARGQTIDLLLKAQPNPVIGHEYESQLRELDAGILERLKTFKQTIAIDMKNLQKTKKSEVQYADPYNAVRTMDGTYYDKRK